MPLSNTTLDILSSRPYFDDYDESKQFHRILHLPKTPVQTRELNQVQSVFQTQIERLASGAYVEGKAVRGGEQSFANNVVSLQLVRDENIDTASFIDAETGLGVVANGATSGARARVVQFSRQPGETYTGVIVAPMNSRTFTSGESVTFETGTVPTPTMLTSPELVVTRPACVYSVREGVFFLRGMLVHVAQQSLVVSDDSSTPSARIGFELAEEIVTEVDDQSLLDPALGFPNYGAPGAHRLRITATLASRPLSGTTSVEQSADENFIEIARVVDGALLVDVREATAATTVTEDTLARRTYDESGDYVVRPFQITTTAHTPSTNVPNANGTVSGSTTTTLIENPDGGRPTAFLTEVQVGDVIVVGGESRTVSTIISDRQLTVNAVFSSAFTNTTFTVVKPDYMTVNLGAGKAYVRGYEYETLGTTKLSIPRARDTRTIDNGTTSTFFGPYVHVTREAGLFDLPTAERMDIHCVPFANTSQYSGGILAVTATSYAASRIGSVRVRSLVYDSGNGDSGTVYKLYVVGAEFESKTYEVLTSGTSDTKLTAAVVCNVGDSSITLTQTAVTTGTFILPRANTALNGATLRLTSIYGVPLYYSVIGTELMTPGSATVTTLKLTTDSSANFALVNTTANVVVAFSDKSIRGFSKSSAKAVGATVALTSRLGGIAAGNTTMSFPDQTPGLFPFRESWIDTDSITDEHYTTTYRVTGVSGTTVGSNREFVIPTLDAGYTYEATVSALPYVNFSVTNASGGVVSLSGASVSISTDRDAKLVIPTTSVGTGNIDVLAKVQVDASVLTGFRRTKTYVAANTNVSSVSVAANILQSDLNKGHVAINANVKAPTGISVNASARIVGLGVPDVFELKKVYAVVDPNNTASWIDVTSRYELDNGQRDWCYDHAALVLRQGFAHYPTANQMMVMVDWLQHSNTSGFFTGKSYGTPITYETLPVYTDSTTGRVYPLRDYADFRFVRQANTAIANTAHNPYVGATQVFSPQTTFPHPDEAFQADYDHYLPRIDKVVLTRDRVLKVLTGQSAVIPVAPNDPEDGITLYTLYHEAYTSDPTLVQTEAVDHRRYTMRDIGRLEKRIERLEYYAQLSQLEERTLNTPELDDDDLERFKNGILIDAFASHAVADVTSPDYRAAIDETARELRPSFSSRAFSMGNLAAGRSPDALTTKTGSLVTLQYTTTEFIKQPLASKAVNVNPFAVTSWRGRIDLVPSTDVWMDTIRRPAVSVNLAGENDNWSEIGFGTVWGDWREVWSGTPTSQVTSSIGGTVLMPGADSRDGAIRPEWTNVRIDAITTSQMGVRERSGTTIRAKNSRVETNLGDRVVDAAIAPFMRSANVMFSATGLKPGANVLAFFDDVDVSAYTERASEIRLANADVAAGFIVGEELTSNASPNPGRATVVAIEGDTLRVVRPVGRFTSTGGSDVSVSAVYPSTFRTTAPPSAAVVSAYVSYAGQVQAVGNTTTVTLDAGASSVPGAYVNEVLSITTGPGSGAKSTITAYNHTTKVATISPPLPSDSLPTTASRYAIGQLATDPSLTTLVSSMGYPAPTASTRRPGAVYGMFYLPGTYLADGVVIEPPVRFNTGSRVFRLSDMPSASGTSTSAESVYQASGSTRTIESTVVSTRNVSFVTEPVTSGQETITRTLGTSLGGALSGTGVYLDPVAQTFLVDPSSDRYPHGVFVTAIDLFFAKRDTERIPVTVQIRPTVNGYPSADQVLSSVERNVVNVVPAGVTPNPDNEAHYTRFTFPEPVYLLPGIEYCVVVLTTSLDYEVMVGEVGKPVLASTRLISEQPYLGSFFKSQNSRTWTAQQEEDLMFTLHRAEFTTQPASVSFFLGETASNTVPGAFTIRPSGDFDYDLYNLQTGHIDFNATASGTTYSFRGTTAATNALTTYTSTVPDVDIALSERNRLRVGNATCVEFKVGMLTSNSHVSPVFDLQRVALTAVKNTIDNGGLYANGFVVVDPGVATSGATTVTLNRSNGGITGIAADGAQSGDGAVAIMTVNSSGQVESIAVSSSGSGYLDDVTINPLATGHGVSWTTPPVLRYRGETSNVMQIEGEEKARYITRRVTLAEGFDARDLKVYVSANRPPDTHIDIYYKVLATGDREDFEDKAWTRMPVVPTQTNVFSTTSRQFREYEYRTRENVASYVANGVTYDRFHTFAIKVVMRSASTTVVPRLRNLRVIALDS